MLRFKQFCIFMIVPLLHNTINIKHVHSLGLGHASKTLNGVRIHYNIHKFCHLLSRFSLLFLFSLSLQFTISSYSPHVFFTSTRKCSFPNSRHFPIIINQVLNKLLLTYRLLLISFDSVIHW